LYNRTHLDLRGDFDLVLPVPRGNDPTILAGVSGSISEIAEDKVTIHTFSTAKTVATTGLLLLIGLAVLSFIRRGTAWLATQAVLLKYVTAWPGLGRLGPEELLRSPIRQQIMQIMSGPAAYSKLADFVKVAARELPVGRFAIYEHLRKLYSAGLIDVVRQDGMKCLYVAPNHGFVEGSEAKALRILSAQPLGRLVGMVLAESPGLVQAEIIRRVQETLRRRGPGDGRTVSRVAVHKWIRKYEGITVEHGVAALGKRKHPSAPEGTKVSLVFRRREGRTVRYDPAPMLIEYFRGGRSAQSASGQSLRVGKNSDGI
jgi:DNA-binding transcriptional ArsR family regulator